MEVTVNVIVKVINLDYGFLESRKQVTRINLLNSQILFEVRVGEGKGWGMLVWVWWGHDNTGSPFSRSPYSRLTSRPKVIS